MTLTAASFYSLCFDVSRHALTCIQTETRKKVRPVNPVAHIIIRGCACVCVICETVWRNISKIAVGESYMLSVVCKSKLLQRALFQHLFHHTLTHISREQKVPANNYIGAYLRKSWKLFMGSLLLTKKSLRTRTTDLRYVKLREREICGSLHNKDGALASSLI